MQVDFEEFFAAMVQSEFAALIQAAQPAEWKPPEAVMKDTLRDKLKRTFDMFDADSSGGVSPSEVLLMLESLGVSVDKEKTIHLMETADADKNGEVRSTPMTQQQRTTCRCRREC